MEVGCEVARCGEDSLSVLALAFAVELLPPLAHEVELRLVVYHNLNLLACFGIQGIAHSCILGSNVLGEWYVLATCFLHRLCTLYQFGNVESCASDGQKTNRCENREASAYIVGDDE